MTAASNVTSPRFHGRIAQTLFWVLLFVSLVPLLIMAGIAYLRARSLLHDQIFSQLAAVVQAQGQRLESEAATGQLLLSNALYEKDVASTVEKILLEEDRNHPSFISERNFIFDSLQTVNQPSPYYNQFLVVRPDGIIQIATHREWEGQKLPSSLQNFWQTGKAITIAANELQPFYEPESLNLVTMIPYRDRDGTTKATLIGFAESAIIQEMVKNAAFYASNQYFVSGQGQFYALNPYADIMNKLALMSPSEQQKGILLTGLQTGERQGVTELLSFKNVPVIAAYTWLPTLQVGWTVEVTQESVFSQINSLLIFAVILFFVFALLIGLLLWQVTQRFTRPLVSLSKTVRNFANGMWEQRAPVNRSDEIGLLASSFNKMADELTDLYHSLESKVEERTSQVRASTEIAQIAISAANLDALLVKALELIMGRFDFAYAAVYLVDERGATLVLHQSSGNNQVAHESFGATTPLDARSLESWVVANNKIRKDQLSRAELLADASSPTIPRERVEVGLPISVGDEVLGVIKIQNRVGEPVTEEILAELQSLTNQVAPTIRSFYLYEAAKIDLRQTSLLYEASHKIAGCATTGEILQAAQEVLKEIPYASALFLVNDDQMSLRFSFVPYTGQPASLPEKIQVPQQVLQRLVSRKSPLLFREQSQPADWPAAITQAPAQMSCDIVAFLPMTGADRLTGLLLLGSRQDDTSAKGAFSVANLQPYTYLVEMVSTALQKVLALESMQKRLRELQTLDAVSQAVSAATDLNRLFHVLHQQLDQVMGAVEFYVALFDTKTQTIHIPYRIEAGETMPMPSFPLGEGLTSALIRSGQPLLLAKASDIKSKAGGSREIGAAARSWLGVPLMLSGQPVGALVVQDSQKEMRFNQDDQRLLTTLAGQVAVSIRNASLLENTRRQAERERQLFEITSKIRRSTDVQTVLKTTVRELSTALGARRAHIAVAPPAAEINDDHAGEESQ
jgi:transcriptional regulator with GAF, ATPase, and Fis domain